MRLLSIDTSTDYLSLAVTRGGQVIAKTHRRVPMMHSTLLVPAIQAILKKARVKLAALDGFCVSVGPGSFTGLRIAVTTVKALAYATGKPVAAVPTLDVIAHNAIRHKGIICPVLDARKGKVYACIYRSDTAKLERLSGELLLPLPDLLKKLREYDDAVILGDMVERAPDLAAAVACYTAKWHPRADVVAHYGAERFREKCFVDPMNLEPLYLYSRECDIKGW